MPQHRRSYVQSGRSLYSLEAPDVFSVAVWLSQRLGGRGRCWDVMVAWLQYSLRQSSSESDVAIQGAQAPSPERRVLDYTGLRQKKQTEVLTFSQG